MRRLVALFSCAATAYGCGAEVRFAPNDSDIAGVTLAAAEFYADSIGGLVAFTDTTWTIDPGRMSSVEELSPEAELEQLLTLWPDSIAGLMREFYSADLASYPVALPSRDSVVDPEFLFEAMDTGRQRWGRFVAFARLAFDSTGDMAVMGVDLGCEPTHRHSCGSNDLLFLGRTSEGWVVVERVRRWVS